MLARILIFIQLVELGAYVAAAYALVNRAGVHPGIAAAALIVFGLTVRALIVAVSFLRTRSYRGAAPVETKLGLAESLRLWWGEYTGNVIGFNWNAIAGPGRPANRAGTRESPRTPVLFVHGYLCNAGFWRDMIRWLSKQDLGPLYTINLEPLTASMDALAEQLAARIDEVLAETGADRLILVAHSMGGLVSRRALEQASTAGRVRRLITLGTPHHGTVLAKSALGSNGREMRPGSKWLSLRNRTPGRLPVPTVSIYSYHDNIVAPQMSACLPGAQNIALTGVGHQDMYRSAEARNLLRNELERTQKTTTK